jgi:hypothetical protein
MHSGRFKCLSIGAILPAIIASACLVSASGATTGAGATVNSFQFVFDGRHVPVTTPGVLGLTHIGTFTASAPFCASGTVADLEHLSPASLRRSYTCGDGTGSMTVAHFGRIEAEHVTGSSGSWVIVGGTGHYTSLRGKGVRTSTYLGGDPDDWETITFRSTASGIADLDADAPQIVVSRASATRLPQPVRVYLIRLAFSARDNVEGNVSSYQVTIKAGASDLAFRRGVTVAGTASLTLRVRPPKGSRRIQIVIAASDPLGNERKQIRSLALRP